MTICEIIISNLPSPHSGVRANLWTVESSSNTWQQERDSLFSSLWKTGYGIVYQVVSLLSALCWLHYSLSYVWKTISVPCFLHCYLLVVSAEMGPGSGDLSSSQGLLDKEPSISSCACKIRAARDRENVKKSHCNYLPILSLPPGLDILYRGGDVLAKQKRQHASLSFQMK